MSSMSRALEDVDAEPSDDEPSDEDPSADEEEQQRIADARALAYANRAARQQRAEALDFAPISSGCIFTTTTYFPDTLVARLRADALHWSEQENLQHLASRMQPEVERRALAMLIASFG